MSASAPEHQPIGSGTIGPAAANWVRRWPLLAFFVIAYGASLLALVVIGLPSTHAAVGPQPAALVMFSVMVTAVGVGGVAWRPRRRATRPAARALWTHATTP